MSTTSRGIALERKAAAYYRNGQQNYKRGAQREREVAEVMREDGWTVVRVAGSRGEADLVALRPGEARFIQVKSSKVPFKGFGPEERAALIKAAEQAGATPMLAWWPYDRKGLRWMGVEAWPEAKRDLTRWKEEDRGHSTPCWIWQGAIHSNGYGVAPAPTRKAHRAVYEKARGPIPTGRDLDHLCRVRACVNPDHLEAVSRSVNLQRGSRGRTTPYTVIAMHLMEATTTLTRQEIGDCFGVSGRTVTRYLARQAGATPVLWWKPPGGELSITGPSDWPKVSSPNAGKSTTTTSPKGKAA